VDPRVLLGLVPAVVLVACSLSADEVAITGGDPLGLWRIMPAGPVGGDWVSAEVSSTALLLVAIAIARGKRLGFWLGLLAMAGAVVVQGGVLGHPVAAAAAVVVASLLVITHRRYDVGTRQRDAVLATGLLVVGGLVVGLGAFRAVNGTTALGDAADAIGSLFDLATPLPVPGLATIGAALFAARIGYLLAAASVLETAPDDRPPEAIGSARRTLRRLGAGPLRPYQDDPACVPVADTDEQAVLVVAASGRTAVVVGDPAGDPAAARRLLESWVDVARRHGLVPVVYQASEPVATALRRDGWKTCAIGRDAIVDPVAFDLGSPRVANLRHTVTRARRGGLRTVVSREGPAALNGVSLRSLIEVDEAWRRDAGPSLGFTVGRFDRDDRRAGITIAAVDDGHRPQALVVLRPTGADGGWMLDLMRRARGGTPGAVELCLADAIALLAADGVRRLSLGLVPLSGLTVSSGPVAERLLAVAARTVRPAYDVRGLAFFKQKFDPAWEPRWLVVRHWWDLLAAVVALLRLHLGGSWSNVLRSVAGSARLVGRRQPAA
jgi:phosphatidylglycerol lysyltransferase